MIYKGASNSTMLNICSSRMKERKKEIAGVSGRAILTNLKRKRKRKKKGERQKIEKISFMMFQRNKKMSSHLRV